MLTISMLMVCLHRRVFDPRSVDEEKAFRRQDRTGRRCGEHGGIPDFVRVHSSPAP
jgi:hypothetical protein